MVLVPISAHAEFGTQKKFFDLKPARNGGIVGGVFAANKQDFFALGDYKGAAPPSVTRQLADRPVDTSKFASLPASDVAGKPASNSYHNNDDNYDPLEQAEGTVRHHWPLPTDEDQKLTSVYGMRTDPFHGRQAFHAGIDIAAPLGTRVLASADGIVDTVGSGSGLGIYVKIKHADDSYSIYGHLARTTVMEGKSVHGGDVVGRIGMTGRTTGPHLHFGIKQGDNLVNPVARLVIPQEIRTHYAGLLMKGLAQENRSNPTKSLEKLAFSR